MPDLLVRMNAHFKIRGKWYDYFETMEKIREKEKQGIISHDTLKIVISALQKFRVDPNDKDFQWIPDLFLPNMLVEYDLWFQEYGASFNKEDDE